MTNSMSHIATFGSSGNSPECHYYGRDLVRATHYKARMGLRIKELREAKGWTQTDLSERSNMSRSQLAMIEAETRPANTLRLNAIATALGVDPDALFSTGSENRAIVELIRRLSPEDRSIVVQMAEALAAKNSAK